MVNYGEYILSSGLKYASLLFMAQFTGNKRELYGGIWNESRRMYCGLIVYPTFISSQKEEEEEKRAELKLQISETKIDQIKAMQTKRNKDPVNCKRVNLSTINRNESNIYGLEKRND